MLKKNIKRNDLAKILSIKTGYPTSFSKKIIDDIFDLISQNIKLGKFILKNIGTFKIIRKKERIGRNPKTKKEYNITARNTLSFIPSKKIINLNE